MFGMRTERNVRLRLQAHSPASRSPSRTYSAIAIEAERPVERMPADADVALGVDGELVVAVLGRGAQPDVDRGHLVLEQRRHDTLALAAKVRQPGRGRSPCRCLYSTSSAVGPSTTLPKTVGVTSTPLVVFVGTARIIRPTSGRASLSKTISSPRRGVTVKRSWPNRRSISSLRSPAALTR